MAISSICSEVAGPFVSKFYVETYGAKGTKTCSNCQSHMTNMAAMPVDNNTL